MDRAPAGHVSAVDLDGIPISLRNVAGTDDHAGMDFDADSRYAGVGYLGLAVAPSVLLVRNVALERTMPICACNCDDLVVLYYIRQYEHLDSRRFGLFPVEGRASRVVIDGMSQVSVYGVWSKRIVRQLVLY